MPLTGIYVKLRNAVTCGDPRPMLNVQLAARFVPVMHPDPAWLCVPKRVPGALSRALLAEQDPSGQSQECLPQDSPRLDDMCDGDTPLRVGHSQPSRLPSVKLRLPAVQGQRIMNFHVGGRWAQSWRHVQRLPVQGGQGRKDH